MENQENIEVNTPNTLLRTAGYYRNLTTTISVEDYDFCKQHGLKFNVLLQERIAQIKAVESGAIVANVDREREKREMFQNRLQFVLDKVGEKNPELIDEIINNPKW